MQVKELTKHLNGIGQMLQKYAICHADIQYI